MTGYTYQEMNEFGFYEFTLIATRKATKTEAKNYGYHGCDFYEDCPCCNCGEDVVLIQTLARPRWSKSSKAMVEETEELWVCAEHAH